MLIKDVQKKIQEELDLCNRYFTLQNSKIENNVNESLQNKIIIMCMKTLSSIKNNELED